MLNDRDFYAVLPAKDLKRARDFYRDKLGIEASEERTEGIVFEAQSGSKIFMYETDNAGTAHNTALAWSVDDIRAEVEELRSRGVVFEEYDFPGLKTENGIATNDEGSSAWFKDSEDNILAITAGM